MRMVTAVLIVLCFVAATPVATYGGEMPDSILEYFPGKWRVESPEGTVVGTVEWKLVAGGKAAAGPGNFTDGGANFGMAGWQEKEKKWVHLWFREDGGYGYLEITRFENNTYFGTQRIADGDGKVVEARFANRVIGPDRFEITVDDGKEKTITQWTRLEKASK